jgi:excisionase family DNA binding protein
MGTALDRESSVRWLNITEAAAYLGVSTKTIRRWIHAGAVNFELRPGRTRPQYFIPLADLDARRPNRQPPGRDVADLVAEQVARWSQSLEAQLAANHQLLSLVESEVRDLRTAVQRGDAPWFGDSLRREGVASDLISDLTPSDGDSFASYGHDHDAPGNGRESDHAVLLRRLRDGLAGLRGQAESLVHAGRPDESAPAGEALLRSVDHLHQLAARLAGEPG